MDSEDKFTALQELFNYLNKINGLKAGLNYTIQRLHQQVSHYSQIQQIQMGPDQTTINFNFIYTKDFQTRYGLGFFDKCIPTSLTPYMTNKVHHVALLESYYEFKPPDLDEAFSDVSNVARLVYSYQFDQEIKGLLISGAEKYLDTIKDK